MKKHEIIAENFLKWIFYFILVRGRRTSYWGFVIKTMKIKKPCLMASCSQSHSLLLIIHIGQATHCLRLKIMHCKTAVFFWFHPLLVTVKHGCTTVKIIPSIHLSLSWSGQTTICSSSWSAPWWAAVHIEHLCPDAWRALPDTPVHLSCDLTDMWPPDPDPQPGRGPWGSGTESPKPSDEGKAAQI